MKTPQKEKGFWISVIPLAIFSLLVIHLELKIEKCTSISNTVLPFGGLIIIYFITVIIQQIKIKKGANNKLCLVNVLLSTGFLFLAFGSTYIPNTYFLEPPILEAESIESSTSLTLRENNSYSTQKGYTCGSCFRIGNYRINNDSLFFMKNEQAVETYLIHEKKFLTPLDEENRPRDSTFWLTITKGK